MSLCTHGVPKPQNPQSIILLQNGDSRFLTTNFSSRGTAGFICPTQPYSLWLWKWLSECLRLEETFGGHLVQPHWSNRDKVSCPGLCSVRILISLKMEILQVLWANCQCLTTLTLKKFYILFRQHLLCFSLCPLFPVLSLSITGKSLTPSSFHPPFRCL